MVKWTGPDFSIMKKGGIMRINIITLATFGRIRSGGWVTNTGQLARSLSLMGHKPAIYQPLAGRTGNAPRPYGQGLEYQPLADVDLLKLPKKAPTILNVVSRPEYHDLALALMKAGAFIVIHDPTEIKDTRFYQQIDRYPVLVNRPRMVHYFSKAYWLPHSYVPTKNVEKPVWKDRKSNAVCLSRIDFDKGIDLILQAHSYLPHHEAAHVEFFGDELRVYSRFLVAPYGWKQHDGIRYPRDGATTAVEKARNYRYMVDMSTIRGDGGGTQWTLLEGADAGCVLVINRGWLTSATKARPSLLDTPISESGSEDELVDGVNCIAVESSAQLATVLVDGYKLINPHTKTPPDWKVQERRLWKEAGLDSSYDDKFGPPARAQMSQRRADMLLQGSQTLLQNHSPQRVVPMLLKIIKELC